MTTGQWAAAQYCDDWSTANPDAKDVPAWVDTGARYLRICRWAARRYTVGDSLPVYIGDHPAPYTRIEQAAWRKYMA